MALEAFDDEEGDPLRLAQADRTLGMTTPTRLFRWDGA
jgi:hypothetical protein